MQVIVFKKSKILKLIRKCKFLKAKNKDNQVETQLLLFTTNFIINSLFD